MATPTRLSGLHIEAEQVTGARTVVRIRRVRRLSRLEQFRARTGGETLAELFGTFLLVLLGDGVVATTVAALGGSARRVGPFGSADWLIICFGWGLAVCFAVYVAGGVSGAHLNPAVTLAFALRRDFDWRKLPAYWLAQLVGAFLAGAVVYLVYHQAMSAYDATMHITSHRHSPGTFSIFATQPAAYFHGGLVGPLVDQVVGTAVLVAIIAALIDQQNQAPEANMSALLVGLTVTVIGMALGANAGFAINPARDFGPRLFAFFAGWGNLALPGDGPGFSAYAWVPVVGPLIGGAVGITAYDLFVGKVLQVREAEGEDTSGQAGAVPEAPYTEPR